MVQKEGTESAAEQEELALVGVAATVDPSDNNLNTQQQVLVDVESQEPVVRQQQQRRRHSVPSSSSSTTRSQRRNKQFGSPRRKTVSGDSSRNNSSSSSSNQHSPFRRLRQSLLFGGGGSSGGRPQTIPENQPLLPLYRQDNEEEEYPKDNKDSGYSITMMAASAGNESTAGSSTDRNVQQQQHRQHYTSSSSSTSLPSSTSVPLNGTSGNSNSSGVHGGTNGESNYVVRKSTTMSSVTTTPPQQQRPEPSTSPVKSSSTVNNNASNAASGNAEKMDNNQEVPDMPMLPASPTNNIKSQSRKGSLLFSGSKKVMKATVVRPARAVSRVFRGSSSSGSGSGGNIATNNNNNGGNGSNKLATVNNGTPLGTGNIHHALLATNGNLGAQQLGTYGSLDQSGHGTVLSLDGTVIDDPTVGSLGRRIVDGGGSRNGNNHPLRGGHLSTTGNKNIDWPVHSMEAITRHIVLACLAYIVGVHHPEFIKQVARTSEFAVTAWVTCLAILILSFFQRRFPHLIGWGDQTEYREVISTTSPVEGQRGRYAATSQPEQRPLLPPQQQQQQQQLSSVQTPSPLQQQQTRATNTAYRSEDVIDNETSVEVEHALVDRVPSIDDDGAHLERAAVQPAEHSSMTDFFVVDTSSGKRVQCNGSVPYHLSNEWFEMDMLVLIRTPDADDSNAPRGTPANEMVSTYMRGKQRRFEFQYQVRLKKKPEGKQIYFACELEETVKMGMVTKAFVGAAMAFIKTTNPTFHYSITGSKDKTGDGKYEKPHMSFTVEGSLDRLVVTKPGETPPQLGQPIYEDPESIRKRKKGMLTDWNTSDTYTMALWSSYVDFLDWRVINLPGIRPFGLSSVLGSQPINLTMYLIDEKRETDKHYRRDIDEVVKLELSNGDVSEMGPAARSWSQSRDQLFQQSGASVSTTAASTNLVTPTPRGRTMSDEANYLSRKNGPLAGGDGRNDTFDTILPMAGGADDLGMDDIEEVDEDVETAAELGEGIYLCSGDSIVLRGLTTGDEDQDRTFSIGVGGGFAVLQQQDVSVVIEKAKKSKKNKLIKSGDSVLFKMLQSSPDSDEIETLYLTIHRGWWLKWVSSMPSKNGYFTIYSNGGDGFGMTAKSMDAEQSRASYLTMGGSFTLVHKRWSKFSVGVAAEPSTTYGGRMLGLYNPKAKNKGMSNDDLRQLPAYGSDDDFDLDKDGPVPASSGWMKPLVLSAIDPNSLLRAAPTAPVPQLKLSRSLDDDDHSTDLPTQSLETKLVFSSDHAQADVPAWIEMMDRVGRVRQLAYAVRVVQRTQSQNADDIDAYDEKIDSESDVETFVRLRTGKELAPIMSIGQSVRLPSLDKTDPEDQEIENTDGDTPRQGSRPRTLSDERGLPSSSIKQVGSDGDQPGILGLDSSTDSPRRRTIGHVSSGSQECDADQWATDDPDDFGMDLDDDDDEEEDDDDIEEESINDEYLDLDEASVVSEMSSESEEERTGALRKGKKLLGKSGKLVKKTVVGTGRMTAKTAVGTTKLAKKAAKGTGKLSGKLAKGTVKKSKKVVKGTVKTGAKGLATAGSLTKTTGKKLIAPVTRKSHKPPKTEPKKKLKEKEDFLGVSKRMRKLEKLERKSASTEFVAGELCAPEQSCRIASNVLQRMSNVEFMSSAWHKCNDALSAEVGYTNDQDRWFLQGTAVDLGVTPNRRDSSRGELLEDCLVARSLWESHWREEWCGMYENCLSFYAPLANSPCLEIAYMDITDVRPLDAGERSPLPGFPLLVLETAWLCHYVAFHDDESRDTFGEKLEYAIQRHIETVEQSASVEQSELRRARFWQGFQTLSETSLSSAAGKWAKVSSNQKKKERAVLNSRRMPFDVDRRDAISVMSDSQKFVEELLSTVLSFSLDSLESDPENFVDFLDLTSQLRFLPVDEMDLTSLEAFCLFVNVYHCLLQHALLLSVNGPLHKKSFSHFMKTSCYEIGGDVFSLAELQCCVIRGKMSRAGSGHKPPYLDAPKKSQAHRHYALGFTDPRVHFVLNTGDVSCPSSIPILTPSYLDEQIQTSSSIFLEKQTQVDLKRRVVVLPKVCDVYRHDFGPGDSLSVLKFCVGSMEAEIASRVRVLLMDEHSLVIKYQHTQEQYHSTLKPLGMGPITFRRVSSESLDLLEI